MNRGPAADRDAVPRVVRNDWSSVAVPDLRGWQPSLMVSVVIPAFECQSTLDLALASLRHQTYPAELLEVIVIDDGSDPPLRLPALRPERTTLRRAPADRWGKANALRFGVEQASGEILHLLDADMVLYPEHIAAHARWHHVLPYAVTLGHKRFVDSAAGWPAPEAVAELWAKGAPDDLFGGDRGEPHEYQERYIAQTDQLRIADHLAFRVFVGATVGLRRELYEAAGGPNPVLRFGNDTEFGYRLDQAGAVFVPEPLARSWHLGRTHVMRAQDQIARYRTAFIADLVPVPRHWRKVGGTGWTVPLVEVVVTVGEEPLERVRACVDSVLRGTERDLGVSLVGPWDQLNQARVPALTDPQLDLRLIAATYRGDPRVRLVTRPPESAFPAPFLLEMTARSALDPKSLEQLVGLADHHQVGAVRVSGNSGVVLWRTAARSRAARVRSGGESLLDAVRAVHGVREERAEALGILDLSQFEVDELANGIDHLDLSRRGRRRPGRVIPSTVEVAGVRSLARAALVVAWNGGRRLRALPRRLLRQWRRR